MNDKNKASIAAIIVAGGVGSRMRQASPKQYLLIRGKSMLEHAADALLAEPRITSLTIVIAPDDLIGQRLKFDDPRVRIARVGGLTRASSVRNGLIFCALDSNDWVLVHDAARPCVRTSDVSKLIDACLQKQTGGILATPVADTIKKANDEHTIETTVSRDGLWAAQTPQCFRSGQLFAALSKFDPSEITDEASAMEKMGLHPLLVEGSSSNIKVTRPEDLWVAEAVFAARSEHAN